jgi:hypothetical protein
MSDAPKDDAALTDTPEIQVFGMGGGFLGATINKLINPTASSLGAQHQTQLVISPTQDALNTRVMSTLIAEFGIDQYTAEALVPAGMIPLVPAAGAGGVPEAPQDSFTYGRMNATWTQVLPLTGGAVGPIGVAAPGIGFPSMGANNASYQFAWSNSRIYPYVNSIAQGAIAYMTDIPTVPVASSTIPAMDGTAAIGISTTWARADHVHPVDTSRYAATNPAGYQTAAQLTASLGPYALTTAVPVASGTPPVMDGTVAVGTGTTWARADHVHPSDTSKVSKAGDTMAGNLQTARLTVSQTGGNIPWVLVTGDNTASDVFGSTLSLFNRTSATGVAMRYSSSQLNVMATDNSGVPAGTPWMQMNAASCLIQVPTTLMGTTTNNNAAAGQIGEFISATVLVGAAINAPTGVAFDLTTISLTAGDWDVQGQVSTTVNATTHVTAMSVWTNTVSATVPATPMGSQHGIVGINATVTPDPMVLPTGRMRLSLAATTTVYLSAKLTLTGGTLTCYGFIGARRRR